MKELEKRPKLGMMKNIVALELESSCAVVKKKGDWRMMIKLRGHGSILDRGVKLARSREEGDNMQGMPE